jgi:hypothetical protein
MSDLTIKVDVFGGTDCRDAIHQMAALASQLRIGVEASLNGVTVRATPFCDSRALGDAWYELMNDKTGQFKYVSGTQYPRILGRPAVSEEG